MIDSNARLIINEIQNLSARISNLPSKSDVKVAVIEGIQEHEDRCQAREQMPEVKVAVIEGIQEHEDRCQARAQMPEVVKTTGEITGVYKVIRDRPSLTPLSIVKGLPRWVQIMIAVGAAVGTAITAIASQ